MKVSTSPASISSIILARWMFSSLSDVSVRWTIALAVLFLAGRFTAGVGAAAGVGVKSLAAVAIFRESVARDFAA